MSHSVIRPGAGGPHAWFLEIVLVRILVCVCVSTPKGINNKSRETQHNNRIKQFYSFSVSLYDTADDKLIGRGLSNNACRECLPKKTKMTRYISAIV